MYTALGSLTLSDSLSAVLLLDKELRSSLHSKRSGVRKRSDEDESRRNSAKDHLSDCKPFVDKAAMLNWWFSLEALTRVLAAPEASCSSGPATSLQGMLPISMATAAKELSYKVPRNIYFNPPKNYNTVNFQFAGLKEFERICYFQRHTAARQPRYCALPFRYRTVSGVINAIERLMIFILPYEFSLSLMFSLSLSVAMIQSSDSEDEPSPVPTPAQLNKQRPSIQLHPGHGGLLSFDNDSSSLDEPHSPTPSRSPIPRAMDPIDPTLLSTNLTRHTRQTSEGIVYPDSLQGSATDLDIALSLGTAPLEARQLYLAVARCIAYPFNAKFQVTTRTLSFNSALGKLRDT